MALMKKFSLRAFLAALGVISICVGFASYRVYRRNLVIDNIVRSGGTVEFHYEMKLEGDDRFDDHTSPPALLVYLFGRDAFSTVGCIRLSDTDSDLQKLTFFPHLYILEAEGAKQNDLDLIGTFTDLRELSLKGPFEDLSAIKRLYNLEHLVIENTGRVELTPIGELRNLQSLWIYNLKATTLEPISDLPKLKTIALDFSQVSSVLPLRRLPKLEEVFLDEVSLPPPNSIEEEREILQRKNPELTVY